MFLGHEQGWVILIVWERCYNVNRQQKQAEPLNFFFFYFSIEEYDLQTGKVRTNIVRRALNSRIDEEIIEST